jgi:hypothetical protein
VALHLPWIFWGQLLQQHQCSHELNLFRLSMLKLVL